MLRQFQLLTVFKHQKPLAINVCQSTRTGRSDGAALRFLLTRLYDWLNTPAGAMVTPKDPLEYLRKLRFFARAATPEGLGL